MDYVDAASRPVAPESSGEKGKKGKGAPKGAADSGRERSVSSTEQPTAGEQVGVIRGGCGDAKASLEGAGKRAPFDDVAATDMLRHGATGRWDVVPPEGLGAEKSAPEPPAQTVESAAVGERVSLAENGNGDLAPSGADSVAQESKVLPQPNDREGCTVGQSPKPEPIPVSSEREEPGAFPSELSPALPVQDSQSQKDAAEGVAGWQPDIRLGEVGLTEATDVDELSGGSAAELGDEGSPKKSREDSGGNAENPRRGVENNEPAEVPHPGQGGADVDAERHPPLKHSSEPSSAVPVYKNDAGDGEVSGRAALGGDELGDKNDEKDGSAGPVEVGAPVLEQAPQEQAAVAAEEAQQGALAREKGPCDEDVGESSGVGVAGAALEVSGREREEPFSAGVQIAAAAPGELGESKESEELEEAKEAGGTGESGDAVAGSLAADAAGTVLDSAAATASAGHADGRNKEECASASASASTGVEGGSSEDGKRGPARGSLGPEASDVDQSTAPCRQTAAAADDRAEAGASRPPECEEPGELEAPEALKEPENPLESATEPQIAGPHQQPDGHDGLSASPVPPSPSSYSASTIPSSLPTLPASLDPPYLSDTPETADEERPPMDSANPLDLLGPPRAATSSADTDADQPQRGESTREVSDKDFFLFPLSYDENQNATVDTIYQIGALGGVLSDNEFPGVDKIGAQFCASYSFLLTRVKSPQKPPYEIFRAVFEASRKYFSLADLRLIGQLVTVVLNENWPNEKELARELERRLPRLSGPAEPFSPQELVSYLRVDSLATALDYLRRMVRDRWKYPLMERRVIYHVLHRFYRENVQPKVCGDLGLEEGTELLVRLRAAYKGRPLTTRPENKDLFLYKLQDSGAAGASDFHHFAKQRTEDQVPEWEARVDEHTEFLYANVEKVCEEFAKQQESGGDYDFAAEYASMCERLDEDYKDAWLRVDFYCFYLQVMEYLLGVAPIFLLAEKDGVFKGDILLSTPWLASCFDMRQARADDRYKVVLPPCFITQELIESEILSPSDLSACEDLKGLEMLHCALPGSVQRVLAK